MITINVTVLLMSLALALSITHWFAIRSIFKKMKRLEKWAGEVGDTVVMLAQIENARTTSEISTLMDKAANGNTGSDRHASVQDVAQTKAEVPH